MDQLESIIQNYPEKFKDDIDKWLFREFGISGGACSSIESMKYSVAREVAEKAMEYAKEQMIKDAVDATIMHFFSTSDNNTPKGRVIFCSNTLDNYKTKEKVKLVIIKED